MKKLWQDFWQCLMFGWRMSSGAILGGGLLVIFSYATENLYYQGHFATQEELLTFLDGAGFVFAMMLSGSITYMFWSALTDTESLPLQPKKDN